MSRRTKVIVVGAVAALIVGAIALFGKSGSDRTADSADQRSNGAAQAEAADNPAPRSHLTGKLEPPRGTVPASDGWQDSSPWNRTTASRPVTATSEHVRHKVADGDSLALLAERYLGSRDMASRIYEANRDLLSDPELLPIGVEIRIPTRETAFASGDTLETKPLVPLRPR